MKIFSLDTGYFKLDGGAMFGVVPKSMWQKINPADENNMCTWAMRCMLVDTGSQRILIDTGLGDKQDEKFRSHFYPHGEDTLIGSLAAHGYRPEDITDVLITHMHFDHVGGAVKYDEKGVAVPTFPNATYWTNEYHLRWALDPNPREKASFLKENIQPLIDHKVLKMIDIEEDVTFNECISIGFYYGHTGAMMVPTLHLPDGHKIWYTADLLPSSGHVGMPYVMSYDVMPLKTMEEKAALFEKVCQENHYIFLEHDPTYSLIQVAKDEKNRVALSNYSSVDLIL